MSTAISVLGGVGVFLIGMTVMAGGLKALAGSALRTVLSKAAATPLRGSFWGAIVTLLVQSSSATTMTTIGLVSAGLLTFPQGLGLVFGANVGTTGTGWLVALIGVRVSLATYALPMIFIGALAKLLAGGRTAAAGGALAGFALVVYGLTTLQQGMGGLAESLHPSDLPEVLGAPGVGWVSGSAGLMTLIVVGLAMTAVMQSSTAAIAVTISAFFAGAVSLEQGAALIIGQNIGTATSSALAAIGASATAKRLALAYVLFKVVAALIAIVAFPFTAALMKVFAASIDGMTLLAAYHTAYNVVGVAVLLPATQWFTRLVERILPSKQTALEHARQPGDRGRDRPAGRGGRADDNHCLGFRCAFGRGPPCGAGHCGGGSHARGGAGFPVRIEGAARDGGRAAAHDEHAARARSHLAPRGSPGGGRAPRTAGRSPP